MSFPGILASDRGPPVHTINFEPLSNDDKAPPLPGTPPPVMSNRGYTTPPQHQEHAIQVQCEMLSNNKNTFIYIILLIFIRVVNSFFSSDSDLLWLLVYWWRNLEYLQKFGGKNMGLHEIYRGKLLETNNYVHWLHRTYSRY